MTSTDIEVAPPTALSEAEFGVIFRSYRGQPAIVVEAHGGDIGQLRPDLDLDGMVGAAVDLLEAHR